jgi:hypothetical protein
LTLASISVKHKIAATISKIARFREPTGGQVTDATRSRRHPDRASRMTAKARGRNKPPERC